MEMKPVDSMNTSDFIDYLSQLLSEARGNVNNDLYPYLKRAHQIILDNPHISIRKENGRVVQPGKRVSICYDERYYYLISNATNQAFAPSLTLESVKVLYNDLENNS